MDNLNNTFSCNKYIAQGKSHKKIICHAKIIAIIM